MIENIEISNTASYTTLAKLDLTKSSFIYGANGSGKTTISRILANHSAYPNCQINWQNQNPLKTVVYNSDFVKDNFSLSETVKGVFTLGENQIEIEEQMKSLKSQIDGIDRDVIQLSNTLKQKYSQLKEREGHFLEVFWQTELKYDNDLQEVFTGLRNNKSKFKDRVKSEFQNRQNNSCALDLDDLKKKYQSIYNSNHQTLAELGLINNDLSQYEKNPILSKKIIGSQDIEIAKLIQELNNSDWVKKGQFYLEKSQNKCPFCQQQINNSLFEQLEKYFDRTFEQDIDNLNNLIRGYENLCQQIKNHNNSLNSDFLDKQALDEKANALFAIFDQNLNKLQNKQSQPSTIVELGITINLIQEINCIIENSNARIKEHNLIVSNIKQEKINLNSLSWDLIIQEMKSDIQEYFSQTNGINRAIENLKKQLNNKQQEKRETSALLQDLEKQITSIRPTVDAINNLLISFGFTNFSLTTTQDNRNYKIVRENGESASETLSEGEKHSSHFCISTNFLKVVILKVVSIKIASL